MNSKQDQERRATTLAAKQHKARQQVLELADASDELSVDEFMAAAFLGVSVFTMRAWRTQGGGPLYSKFGERVRYRLGRLREFRDAREVSASNVPVPSAGTG